MRTRYLLLLIEDLLWQRQLRALKEYRWEQPHQVQAMQSRQLRQLQVSPPDQMQASSPYQHQAHPTLLKNSPIKVPIANPPRLRHPLAEASVPIHATRAKEERARIPLARLEETSLGREKGRDLAVKASACVDGVFLVANTLLHLLACDLICSPE